jgi:putative PIN family toxin of toxin-antitoxin system
VRVVLDTNVLVSALLFTGISSELVPLWQRSIITVLLSRGILEEYLRVLSYPKFQLSEAEIKGLIEEELLPYVEVVNPRRPCALLTVTRRTISFLNARLQERRE